MKFLLSFIFAILLPISIIAQSTGTLKFQTDLENYFIIIDDDFEDPVKLSGPNSIEVTPGVHKFTLIHPDINDRIFNQVITANKSETIVFFNYTLTNHPIRSSHPIIQWNSNLMIFSEPGAQIYIDDSHIGEYYAKAMLESGKYEFKVKNGTYSKEQEISIDKGEFNVITLTTLPRRKTARVYSIIPGLSQFYKKEKIKAMGISIGFAALTTTSLIYYSKFLKADDKYRDIKKEYNRALDPYEAYELGLEAEYFLDRSNKYYTISKNTFFAVGTVYLLNLADAWLNKPERGYYKGWHFDPYTDFSNEENYFGLNIRKEF